MDHAPRKFGKFSEKTILAAVERDREAAAAASDGWHQSHGCVIDRYGRIVVLPVTKGQANLYNNDTPDPTRQLADARFIVNARGSVERRCDMIEALLTYIVSLEAPRTFHAECPSCGAPVDVVSGTIDGSCVS